MHGKIQIDPMITHVMPLNDIKGAFDAMKKDESITEGRRFSRAVTPRFRSQAARKSSYQERPLAAAYKLFFNRTANLPES